MAIHKFLFVLLIVIFFASCGKTTENNEDAAVEKRVDSLMALLSLEEKIGQLNLYTGRWDMTGAPPSAENAQRQLEDIKNGRVGAMLNVLTVEAVREAQKLAVENSPHHIPLLFGYDVIHGYQTMFPIPLAEAASWDMAVIERNSQIFAAEAAAAGINWVFGPMMDISRDARWGRIMEGSGEDPYLGALIAAARIKGLQGESLSSVSTVAACAKHFAGYGFVEAGRDYNTVEMSLYTFHNVVLPPFKAAAEAGAASFMNSFSCTNGIPATGDVYMQRDILKGAWKYNGFMVSDWASIGGMIKHGYAKDNKDAALKGIVAGCDMDMESYAYIDHLEELITEKKFDIKLIDDAVRRILRIKFKLGLFDDPYRYCDAERQKNTLGNAEHFVQAREAARKSIVLLKNENNLLPLSKDIQSLAVIGPLANDKDSPLGSWRAQAVPNSAVSVLEGIKAALPNTEIFYAKGCDIYLGERAFIYDLTINNSYTSGFLEAVAAARKAEKVIMVLGEDCYMTGEGRSQTEIDMPGVQLDLLKAVYAVNKNIVLVLMNGRPLVLNWENENIPAILETWHLGNESGNAIADVLFGDYNPSGKLTVSFPRAVGQCPIAYNHLNTGHAIQSDRLVFYSHYTDQSNEPLFPFGYGLSYSTFEYSDIVLSDSIMKMNGEIKVSVTVTNTSTVEGKETVQLYIRDIYAELTRPVKELKGFQQIILKAGESKKVEFTLTKNDLGYYNNAYEYVTEIGDFYVFIGTNSRDVKTAAFSVVQ